MNPSATPDACRSAAAPGTLCALVAIKSRAHCKSRLAGVLAEPVRRALVRSMLVNVLDALQAARSVDAILVISPERDGVPADTAVLTDSGESLNAALTQAHAQLRALGHSEALILPADLPHLTAREIETFLQAGRHSGCAIAPDRAHLGTNALFLRTHTPFTFRFGPDSLRLHLREAAERGCTARIIDLPGMAFDVDEPADLEALGHAREEAAWPTTARL
ncbi:MAG TPA: 2-phospho-L-lactate guanylyltransferase [Steroidobacteraceae bacterium]|nr:2-phospho-L-lactate guanylyltransferase [Steroidobacteraceae bacterium]